MSRGFLFILAIDLLAFPPLAAAEILTFQCSIRGEYPRPVTIDDEAMTVNGLGSNLKVYKIGRQAVWMTSFEEEGGSQSLIVTVIDRQKTRAGNLETTYFSGPEPKSAYPSGMCWERSD